MKWPLLSCVFAFVCCDNANTYYYEEYESDIDHEVHDTYWEDGIHEADVGYYNPETGHSATYSIEVEVQEDRVVQINFPKGGWLDEDHITPGEIDESGYAFVEGEDGKEFEIHITD